jgi:pantothenate kinase type III
MIEATAAITYDIVQADKLGAGGALSRGIATVYDLSRFQSAVEAAALQHTRAAGRAEAASKVAQTESGGFRAVLANLQSLNGRVDVMGGDAMQYARSGRELTPGDMLQLTVRAHEFLFHCELSSNVANRTSEGVQQLFRQQS